MESEETKKLNEQLRLISEREDMFKSLGKEVYVNYLMATDMIKMKEFDQKMREIEDKLGELGVMLTSEDYE